MFYLKVYILKENIHNEHYESSAYYETYFE